jgi:4'-phosphopantetheinyl transferase
MEQQPSFLPTANATSVSRIGDSEVVVWRLKANACAEEYPIARELLSKDELIRAERFFREEDRVKFTLQRAHLRTRLGAYLNAMPRKIEFVQNEYGKPSVAAGPSGLEFNVSGSGDYGLMAFSKSAVGVDIEKYREIGLIELAEDVFSPGECRELKALPEELRTRGFFNAWTRKEAFIKATGRGLSFRLNRFSVNLTPGIPAQLLQIEGEEYHANDWNLKELPAPEGYAVAVVRRGGPFSVSLREVPPLA